MRILVDKMPVRSKDCPYAENLGQEHPTCTLRSIGCKTPLDCPIFASLKVTPIKHAHWDDIGMGIAECSACGGKLQRQFGHLDYKYCPYCGAEIEQ